MQTEQITPLPCPVNKPVDNSPGASDYLDTYAYLKKYLKTGELREKRFLNMPVDNLCITQPAERVDLPEKRSNLTKLIAKYLFHSGYASEANRLSNCGQTWLPFSCSAGHKIYRKISCGLPYCPICSEKGSWYNERRINRLNDTLLGFPMLGHYVFTLPKEVSLELPSSDLIDKLYKLAWKILKEFFDAEAVIIVLHFCGDKSTGLHLHFDCTFPILHRNGDCDYPLGILNLARDEWTIGINKIFNREFKDTVGHYNFVNTIEQERHLIRYVTRSTITADKFIELTEAQREYCIRMNKRKTIRSFGKFVGKGKAGFLAQYKCFRVIDRGEQAMDLISQGICPICNEKMRPAAPIPLDDIPLTQIEQYNGHTLIDKQIAAFLREQTRKENQLIELKALINSVFA